MDADNTLETCWEVTTRTLHETFDALYEHASRPPGHAAQAEHGHRRQGLLRRRPRPSEIAAGDGATASSAIVPARRAGNRLPLRRTVRGAGDREPERDQPDRRPVAALVLLRARAPGVGAEAWGGDAANAEAAQAVFAHRARMNALAVGRRVDRRAGAAGRGVAVVAAAPWPPSLTRSRSTSSTALRALAAAAAPVPAPSEVRSIWRAQVDSRQADYAARWLAAARAQLLHDRLRRVTSRTPLSRSRCASTTRRSCTTARAPSISRAPRRRGSTGSGTSCSASSRRPTSRSPAGGTRSSGGASSRSSR